MMKKLLLQLIYRASRVDAVYVVMERLVGKPWRIFHESRLREVRVASDREAIYKLIPDQTVRHGPFAGLRYARLDAVGSTLFPKLLGCYEMELHSAMQEICGNDYETAVVIGCAEGYYAVGLALRWAEMRLAAYDTDPKARELCLAMASANGVADRVEVLGVCTREELISRVSGRRALVVSDCEGYEMELFDEQTVRALIDSDVLIECHNSIDPEITPRLERMFGASHVCMVIPAVYDYQRARGMSYPELEGESIGSKVALVSEYRTPGTEWLVCVPK